MLQEFRQFIARGNVIDLAVGIIIGAAFTAIVNSVVNDLVNPLLGLVTAGINFNSLGIRIGEGETAPFIAYGKFITAVINFFIIAFIVFLLVKAVNKIKDAAEAHAMREATPEKPAGPTEKEVLIEIRDLLRERRADQPAAEPR